MSHVTSECPFWERGGIYPRWNRPQGRWNRVKCRNSVAYSKNGNFKKLALLGQLPFSLLKLYMYRVSQKIVQRLIEFRKVMMT